MSKDKYPEIVYKYRRWDDEYHRKILEQNELFLASPKDFNDPFDCRIPMNFFLLDTKEKIKQYTNEFTIRQFDKLTERGFDIEAKMKSIENLLTTDLKGVQQKNEESLFREQDKRLGVLSLSKKWDNILMWSHYSSFHRGFCVGFWEEKLRKSKAFGKGGPVIYSPNDDYPEVSPLNEQDPMQKSYIETHSKAKDWDYEDEYRLTRLFYPIYPTIEDRKIHISDDFFAEIILGIQIPENHKQMILQLANNKSIPVYQATKIPFKFLIDRIKVN